MGYLARLIKGLFPNDTLDRAVKAFLVGSLGAVAHAHYANGNVVGYIISDWQVILSAGLTLAVAQLGLSGLANGIGSNPNSSSFAGVTKKGDDDGS